MKKTRTQVKQTISSDDKYQEESDDENIQRKVKKVSLKKNDSNSKKSAHKYEEVSITLLKSIFDKIKLKSEKFEEKPEYLFDIVDKENEKMKKILTISKFKIIHKIELFYKELYQEKNNIKCTQDICTICQYEFIEEFKSKKIEDLFEEDKNETNHIILLNNCTDHFFHLDCLENMISDKSFIKCPNCNKIYGILTGDQPDGVFTAKIIKTKCDGYKSDSIEIEIYFPDGSNYTGTRRFGFLPNIPEGREILALFKVAFDRKLLFTIGTSVTTGQTNTTIWNGIHFKTNTHGGSTNFGYPDPMYFNRVKQELAAKGIMKDSIEENLDDIVDKILSKNKNKRKNK